MTTRAAMIVLVLAGSSAVAQEHHGTAQRPAQLMSGLGDYHHPITTSNPQAQRFFDQGLRLVYAFNHEEAVRAFQRAAVLDPHAAMPLWGIAYALGPNINMDVDPAGEKAAFDAEQKALALAAGAPRHERGYIEALAKRYSDDPKADLKALAVDYKNAMGELMKRYPDDLDAATLYAESAMDLRPWQLWSNDGTPAEGTKELIRVLESVLKRAPNHPGANHYYIHAVEASPHPERAYASAKRLETLMPAAGHLVHMPAHIYMRTGDYAGAAARNAVAAEVDRAYIRSSGAQGMYPMMYYSHNLQFLAAADMMLGRSAGAREAADQLIANIGPHAADLPPMVQPALLTPAFVALRFGQWDTALKTPEPDKQMLSAHALWHYIRGMAFAGQHDRERAAAERDAFAAEQKEIAPDLLIGLNKASDVLHVAAAVLEARIRTANGDLPGAIESWRRAVALEDTLAYAEPADWYYPVRESLGGALLAVGSAADAEPVFRADLDRNPRNPRSLFGLAESLKAQGKTVAAESIQREFAVAWKNADVKLRVEDL